MKTRKLHIVIALALIVLFASQAFAADIDTKKATTSTYNPDQITAGDVLTFFGGTNLRLYSKYYEGGTNPWDVYLKMCATFGITADLGPVFMGLTLSTGEIDSSNPTYGKPKDNMVAFSFLNDFSAVFKDAYAIWRTQEMFYMVLGRNPWTIDKNKKMYVFRSDITFDSGLRFDTLGFFPIFFDKDGRVFSMSGILSYLGKYLSPTVPVDHPGYRHFWLVGLQPKVDMKLEMMNLLLGGGLWGITHPNDLLEAGGAEKEWGEDVFGSNKDANLVLLELFAKISMKEVNVFMHTMFNLGAEEQNVGAIIGLYFGAKKKTGDFGFGASLYYIENYAWLANFTSGTLGAGYKGLQLCFDWVFFQNMTFYAQCTFKNEIGDSEDHTGQIYLKTGVCVKFSLKPNK